MKLTVSLSEFLAILPNMLPIIILMLLLILMAVLSLLKKELPLSQKVIWLLVIVCVSFIGPILYFSVGAKMIDEKIQTITEEK